MSETKEGFFYDLYDFTKSVYIFSHMKTNLVDTAVQIGEKVALSLILAITSGLAFFVLFKLIIIILYFTFVQIIAAFISFINIIFISKFDIFWKSSLTNGCSYIMKVLKRIYTFNFYIFYNKAVCTFLIISFVTCIISNLCFNAINLDQIETLEKDNYFYAFYFLTFEINLLIEFICYMFYSNKNILFGSILSFVYWIVINIIIIVCFYFAQRYEYLYGVLLTEQPQKFLNIAIFSTLLILKLNCLFNIIKHNNQSK